MALTVMPRCRRPAQAVAILALAGWLAGCASAGSAGGGVSGSVQQPLRDLSVLRESPAEVLVRARQAPYAPPADPACPSIAAELALLDAALGPDIDAERAKTSGGLASSLASGAIGDLLSLPYRGVVRRMTGAERREQEARAAKLAGSIRRGFLKGWARGVGCPAASPVP